MMSFEPIFIFHNTNRLHSTYFKSFCFLPVCLKVITSITYSTFLNYSTFNLTELSNGVTIDAIIFLSYNRFYNSRPFFYYLEKNLNLKKINLEFIKRKCSIQS